MSVGLLHGRASHIIWPPHRWQQIKPSLPANRGPLDTQEEEGWRREHTNIQLKYVGNVIWSRRGVRQLQRPDRQTLFLKSQIQGNRRWSRSDGSMNCLTVCSVNVATAQWFLSDGHRASRRQGRLVMLLWCQRPACDCCCFSVWFHCELSIICFGLLVE